MSPMYRVFQAYFFGLSAKLLFLKALIRGCITRLGHNGLRNRQYRLLLNNSLIELR